jgi:L-ascorbate metabolism protein UlaG (beta-lactamase superfamily)
MTKMKMKSIVSSLTLSFALAGCSAAVQANVSSPTQTQTQQVQVQLIRNATVKVTYGDTTFLVDPMLAPKDAYPGFEGTYRSELRNPLIELPMSAQDVVKDVDAVVVTHTHLDHWDEAAQKQLRKDIPLFAQDEADAGLIRSQGFTDVRVLGENAEFGGVNLSQTDGQHGADAMYAVPDMAKVLGNVMGVTFQAPGQKTVYIAGDTIWRHDVEQALVKFNPDVIVLNTGNALLNGIQESIIMGKEDTLRAYQAAPKASVVAVHMDTVNHGALTRTDLRAYIQEKRIQDRVLIPADGETLKF